MRSRAFRPVINDILDDRIVLSHAGAVALVHSAAAHPTAGGANPPVLRAATLNDVNRQIGVAFVRFGLDYQLEFVQATKSHNAGHFQGLLADSAGRLQQALDAQASRLPGSHQTLAETLDARVSGLLSSLSTSTTQSGATLILADQSGARADVAAYVHAGVAGGDFSLH